MDKIYGAAKATIVAGVGSDAWAGLPGVGENPKPRTKRQSFRFISGLPLVTVLQPYYQWQSNSFWNCRGWTFQEKFLSKRLLVFGDEQVYFECKTDLWFEDTVRENFDPSIHSRLLENDTVLSGWPSVQYVGLVMRYTNRLFGFGDDVLHAFRGLENLLQPSLTEKFLWGLPVSMFDMALNWVFPFHYPDRRRGNFPSWSWTGWDFSGIWRGFLISFPDFRTVGREVLWHRVSEGTPYRAEVIDSCQPAYVHKPIPPNIQGDLTYIVPVDKESIITEQFSVTTTYFRLQHILLFWTSTACFKVGRTESWAKVYGQDPWEADLDRQQNNILVDIYGKADEEIGQINLHRDWRQAKPDILQFIVISRFCRYSVNNRPNGFFILLIEWINGVAFRVQAPMKAVAKEDWEAAEPEWKLITLA